MKLSEIRPCDECGGQIAPIFYVVRSSIAMFDSKATNQTLGLMQYFGGGTAGLALAEVMGGRSEVVKIGGYEDERLWTEIILCQECYMKKVNLALLAEKISDRESDSEDDVGE